MDWTDNMNSRICNATNLDGAKWHMYSDGSGALEYNGETYFSYDKNPYAIQNGIEYQKTLESHYDVFWGSFEQFRESAENYVKKHYAKEV